MDDVKMVIDKLETMDKRLDSIDITLVKQAKDLEYHIKRTDILQEMVVPMQEHVSLVNTTMKVLMALGGLIGFIATIYVAIK